MARPETIECEVCGTVVPVAARGRIPRFCAAHSTADLTADDAQDPQNDVEAAGEPQTVEVPAVSPPVDDGWPKRIAPLAWIGPSGQRWTDLGEAQAAMAQIRRDSG